MTDQWHCPFCRCAWPFLDLYMGADGQYGCPRCRGSELSLLCDEPGCGDMATDVWVTTRSITRKTCAKHHNYWRKKR